MRRGDDLKEEKGEGIKETRGVKENEEGAVGEEREECKENKGGWVKDREDK